MLSDSQRMRTLARIDRQENGCWYWTGRTDPRGYGRVSHAISGKRVTWVAHRLVYELLVGPIPVGLTLDHLCHTQVVATGGCQGGDACLHRRCVNPAHLEPTTRAENTRRSPIAQTRGIPIAIKASAQKRLAATTCKRGHSFDEANTYIDAIGARQCRKCQAAKTARLRAAKRVGPPPVPMSQRTHCPQGHRYDLQNTYHAKSGSRHCLTCIRQRSEARRAAKKERGATG